VRVGWFTLFDQALRSTDVIAVWAAVENHLDRPLTSSERAAARHAANRYAAASNVRIVRVPAPAGRTIPLPARADADLDDVERLTAVATNTMTAKPQRGRSVRNVAQRAETLIGNVTKSARTARHIRAARLDPRHAAQLADDLATAMDALHHLEQRLRLRADRRDS
jgi:hypothetical protein